MDLLADQFATVTALEPVWDELTEGDAGVDTLRTLRERDVLDVVPFEPDPLSIERIRGWMSVNCSDVLPL